VSWVRHVGVCEIKLILYGIWRSGYLRWRANVTFDSKPISGEQVKVKLSLCLTKHHTMKAYWDNRQTKMFSYHM
jgi:hypothetical protein